MWVSFTWGEKLRESHLDAYKKMHVSLVHLHQALKNRKLIGAILKF